MRKKIESSIFLVRDSVLWGCGASLWWINRDYLEFISNKRNTDYQQKNSVSFLTDLFIYRFVSSTINSIKECIKGSINENVKRRTLA